MIFRLATCCGLRVSEVVGLTLSNVKLVGKRPHIYVPKAIAKRNHPYGKETRTPLKPFDVRTSNASVSRILGRRQCPSTEMQDSSGGISECAHTVIGG